MKQYIKLLIKKAKQSNCNYRVSALGLNKKGEIVGSVVNRKRFNRLGGTIHAELNLMRKYGKQLKSIVICRINNNDKLLPLDPCPVCAEKARELGIKIYSTYDKENGT